MMNRYTFLISLAIMLFLFSCHNPTSLETKYAGDIVIYPPSGTYCQGFFAQMKCTDPKSTIRYTVDGTEPNENSPIYTNPIPVLNSTIIKSKSYRKGYYSEVGLSYYNIDENTPIVSWGVTAYYPNNMEFLDIKPGLGCNLALKQDSSLVAWGGWQNALYYVPPGHDYRAIAAGPDFCLALHSSGLLEAWGYNYNGQCNIPNGIEFKKIEACVANGGSHSWGLAIKSDGSLTAWGDNTYGQCNVPIGNNFIKIAAGERHGLALKNNGNIIGWGCNEHGECNIPSDSTFMDISAGGCFSVALKSDGSIMAWGINTDGQCNYPTGSNYISINAGFEHCLALTSNHSIKTWGVGSTFDSYFDDSIYYGDGNPGYAPLGNNFVKISAGKWTNFALIDIDLKKSMRKIKTNFAVH
jgi:hypothetical protein